LADTVAQFIPAFERRIDERWFPFNGVRKPGHLHLLQGGVKPSGAYVVHRKEPERLYLRSPIGSEMQKFDMPLTFPKIVPRAISASVPTGNDPLTSSADPPVNERR